MFALEAEIGFVVKGSKLQQHISPFSKKQVKEAVTEVCLCLELVGTRYKDVENATTYQKLADCICAGGVVSKSIPCKSSLHIA